jgi:serine/threonine protein kinase
MNDPDRPPAPGLRPAVELPPTEAHGSGQGAARSGASPAAGPPAAGVTATAAPTWIGPYEVVRPLGSGGMGTVYLARQRQPLERLVAVKLIRGGAGDERRALRFEAERRALARMSHPNIAQVYEAGTTADGQPYIAMEHVPGEPITAWCDDHCLPVEQRLRLFVEVCRGVQHLHQKGILHRDLKPSNILVMEEQGRPLAKIIDLGVAKAIDRPLVDGPDLTEQHLVGTPGYHSPESILAADGELDQDTRSDVHGLGLVLFELLLGVRPQQLDGLSLLAALRLITEQDPPTLAERWRQLVAAERAALATVRATTPTALARELADDLGWIVAKAIARERELRYGSAAELAADLERHLRNEPVTASPPSRLYRLRKAIRRHRVVAVAGVAVAVALVLGIAARTLEAQRANREAARANAEATRANREAAAAREVSDFLLDLFKVSDPDRSRGNTITAREILDRGAAHIQENLADQPLTQAHLMDTMGHVYTLLGLHDAARPLLEGGLATRRRLLAADAPEVIESIEHLAALDTETARWDEAEALHREALAANERRYGAASRQAARAITKVAILLHNRGRLDEAIPLQQRALASLDRLGPPDDDYLTGLNNLGTLYLDLGRFVEAEPIVRRTVALREELLGPDNPSVAQSLSNLALLLLNTKRGSEARPLLERAVAIREKVLGPEHPNLAWSLRLLAETYRLDKSYDQTQAILDRCLALQEKALGPRHPFLALTLESLGNLARERGDLASAQGYLERCVAVAEPALGHEHLDLAYYLRSLANVYRDQRRFAAAEPLYRRALAIFAKQQAGAADRKEARDDYAAMLRAAGRPAEAQALLAEAGGG